MKHIGVLLAGLFAVAAFGNEFDPVTLPGGRHSLSVHVAASQARLAMRMGICGKALEHLYGSFAGAVIRDGEPQRCQFERLADLASHTDTARTAFVETLAAAGPDALDEALFKAVFDMRIDLNRQLPSRYERSKTIVLLAFIEDLIRDRRVQQGLPAAWYDRANGFQEGVSHVDYRFDDGDVLLVLGGSSIASLITQSTYPQRRFSHALLLRIRGDRMRPVEALIERGAVSRDKATFAAVGVNAVQVLRWRHAETRASVAASASDRALRYVEGQWPYDAAMNLDDPSRVFCSELVARAYHEASGNALEAFIPEYSRVRSERVMAYIETIGVRRPDMISPGDLTASPFFEVVAEFRNTTQMFRLWEMLLMGDVFIERLDMGYRFRPGVRHELLASFAGTGDLMLRIPSTIPGIDLSLIPSSLNARALASLMTLEKTLYARAYREARRSMGESYSTRMSELIPWEYRGALSFAIQDDVRLRTVLRPPRHR